MGVADPVGDHLLVLARGQEGYNQLSVQISRAQLDGGEKGRPLYDLDALANAAQDQWLILTGCRKGRVRRALPHGGPAAARGEIRCLMDRFGRGNVLVELSTQLLPTDDEDNDALADARPGVGCARGRHHRRALRRPAIQPGWPRRWRRSAAGAAWTRPTPSCRPVRGRTCGRGRRWRPCSPGTRRRFRRPPRSAGTARSTCTWWRRSCRPMTSRRVMTRTPTCGSSPWPAPARRYGTAGEPAGCLRSRSRKNCSIIADLNFPGYFLIVHDIVDFCRKADILCQGRGSAANSAVCYALGITAVDAVRYQLLFERFLAPERDGPPDIDIDIESDRREEVIQYVYRAVRTRLRRTGGQRQHLPAADGGAGHGQGARSLTRPAGRVLQTARRLVAAGRADRECAQRRRRASNTPFRSMSWTWPGRSRISRGTWVSIPAEW